MDTRKIILDTDPGIDDALAILLALASPELELLGLTVTSGNCTARQGVENALAVLELAGRPGIPVFKGADIPLVQPLLIASDTHGTAGLGYASLPRPNRSLRRSTLSTISSNQSCSTRTKSPSWQSGR